MIMIQLLIINVNLYSDLGGRRMNVEFKFSCRPLLYIRDVIYFTGPMREVRWELLSVYRVKVTGLDICRGGSLGS